MVDRVTAWWRERATPWIRKNWRYLLIIPAVLAALRLILPRVGPSPRREEELREEFEVVGAKADKELDALEAGAEQALEAAEAQSDKELEAFDRKQAKAAEQLRKDEEETNRWLNDLVK